MDKPLKNQELDLVIENLAFGGRGVARLNGYVIFVEGAVPKDRVRAQITRAKSSYAEARVLEVVKPSAARILPRCRHFGICGGCSWQSLEYEQQLNFKHRQLLECFKHIGGFEAGFDIDLPLAAEPAWRYRNKVEFSFAGTLSGGIDLGFHLPGEWRRVLNLEDCLLHSEISNQIRNHIREFASFSGLAAYDQGSESGFWRHLVIREAARTGEIMVNVVTAAADFPRQEEFASKLTAAFPQISSLIWSVNSTKASVATGFPCQILAGKGHIFEELGGVRLKVSPGSFLQTNSFMAEKLYAKVLQFALAQKDDEVFDLYCGIGSITLLLARHCRSVFGVEINEEAVDLARENASANLVANAVFQAGKVRSVLKQARGKPNVVIMDPPRAGASKKEIGRIIETEAQRIIYVSCNASTMASNASQLAEAGYKITRMGAVDMFPHTPHVEAVARFELKSGS